RDRGPSGQTMTDTTSQAMVARSRSPHAARWAASAHTRAPNTIRPMLPATAPAASSPAASSPSCFFTSVRLAGRMAGKARNRPPTAGPYVVPRTPARAVTRPPKAKRTAYSRHDVLRRHEGSALIVSKRDVTVMGPSPPCGGPQAEGHGQPPEPRRRRGHDRVPPVAQEQARDGPTIGAQRDGPQDHRMPVHGRVVDALRQEGEP